MKTTVERGDVGEKIAREFLLGQGFVILETKFRYGRGEIDIVGEDHGELVFVEVKARTSLRFGEPEESVTAAKERRMRKAAVGYCLRNRMTDRFYRFDIVSVRFRGQVIVVKHIRNALTFS